MARRFLERAEYVSRSTDGSLVRLTRRGQGLKVLPSKGIQDSLILDTSEAATALRTKLHRAGLSPDEVNVYASRFSALTEDVPLPIPTGEIFVKRPMGTTRPRLSATQTDNRFFVLVALEFATLILGERVMRPSFDYAREFVRLATPTEAVQVRQALVRKPYEPFHALLLQETDGLLSVQVRLFRCIVTEVVFSNISYRGIRSAYYEDLEGTEGFFAPDLDNSEEKQWIRIR